MLKTSVHISMANNTSSESEAQDHQDISPLSVAYSQKNGLAVNLLENSGLAHDRPEPNPLAKAAQAAAASADPNAHPPDSMPHSVVPDLMRVYESMMQSKTTQDPLPPNNNNAAMDHHPLPPYAEEGKQPPSSETSSYYAPSSSVTIPPPYPLPPLAPTMPAPAATAPTKRGPSERRKRTTPSPTATNTTEPSTRSTKSRRKGPKEKDDGRWTKRFTWPDELHQDFVAAIFDVGLKHASPSTVLDQMPPHEQITTERIKSHLQKYRLHREKSKKEFMSCYAAALARHRTDGLQGVTSLAGGSMAGHLTYATLTQPDPSAGEDGAESPTKVPSATATATANPVAPPPQTPEKDVTQDVFIVPRLTEEEKVSPIGASLGYLMGLFFSLKTQLEQQRKKDSNAKPAGTPDDEGSKAAATTTTGQKSASRSSFEASSMMKREMESQMTFQNKMRALKQHELNKLAGIPKSVCPSGDAPPEPDEQQQQDDKLPVPPSAEDRRDRSSSVAADDESEFWNSEEIWSAAALDGELFKFLMDP